MFKFDEIVLREVSKILLQYFPDKFVSVTQVHVSKDLAFAKIWLSCLTDVDKIVRDSKKKAGVFRDILAKTLVARKVPRLYFVADYTQDDAAKIENLINTTNGSD